MARAAGSISMEEFFPLMRKETLLKGVWFHEQPGAEVTRCVLYLDDIPDEIVIARLFGDSGRITNFSLLPRMGDIDFEEGPFRSFPEGEVALGIRYLEFLGKQGVDRLVILVEE